MNASDIKDEQTLRTWLETRPQADSVAIATRAALRLLPGWCAQMTDDWARKADLTSLSMLRLTLTSSVALSYTSAELQDANQSAESLSRSIRALEASSLGALSGKSVGLNARHAYFAVHSAESSALSARSRKFAFHSARAAAYGTHFAAPSIVWDIVCSDCMLLEQDHNLRDIALWHLYESPLQTQWSYTKTIWATEGETYAFWLRWYEAALGGRSLNSDLERDIALIPDADWEKGAEHIAGLIAGLEKQHDAKDDATSLDSELAKLPAATKDQRATFAQAVSAHREHLPATLSALLEFCAAEISRLQGRNHPYDSPAEEAEAQRQIRVLTTIYATLERLKAEIPETGPLTEANIVNGEKLSRLFVRHFKEWPRKNAEDIIDSTYRAALVGLTATVGPMIGIPVNLAVGAGVVFFGGKKIVDGLKAAKDLTLP